MEGLLGMECFSVGVVAGNGTEGFGTVATSYGDLAFGG